jgi:hypothetical protein
MVKGNGSDQHEALPSLLPSKQHIFCWRGRWRNLRGSDSGDTIVNQVKGYRKLGNFVRLLVPDYSHAVVAVPRLVSIGRDRRTVPLFLLVAVFTQQLEITDVVETASAQRNDMVVVLHIGEIRQS